LEGTYLILNFGGKGRGGKKFRVPSSREGNLFACGGRKKWILPLSITGGGDFQLAGVKGWRYYIHPVFDERRKGGVRGGEKGRGKKVLDSVARTYILLSLPKRQKDSCLQPLNEGKGGKEIEQLPIGEAKKAFLMRRVRTLLFPGGGGRWKHHQGALL